MEQISDYGRWQVIAYPTLHQKDRVTEHAILRTFIEQSVVYLRGWDFPHLDRESTSNTNKGITSNTAWHHGIEGFNADFDGLFVFEQALWEDREEFYKGSPEPLLEFISAIWTIVEFFIFFRRYYERISPDSSIHIEIRILKLAGRKLFSSDLGIRLPRGRNTTQEDEFEYIREITQSELRASPESLAADCTRRLFALFGWDADMKMIESWQQKLIQRKT